MASTKLPVKTLTELIAYAKERPNQLNYGSVGIGSSQHLAGAYFEQVAGAKLTHVPYRNIAQYTPDLIAGTVPLGFQWLPNVLAALNSRRRPSARGREQDNEWRRFPTCPPPRRPASRTTQASGWFVMLAPRGTPKPIVDQAQPRVHRRPGGSGSCAQKFTEQGAEPVIFTPEELAKFISAEIVKWRDIITKAGIQPIQ